MGALTAAHRTLPFGTRIEVVRLDTGARVRVRVNDRGPFVDGRIVDLSRAAARRLDMIEAGVVRVGLRIVDARGRRSSRPAAPPMVGSAP
jgi:rare lipoprotein A